MSTFDQAEKSAATLEAIAALVQKSEKEGPFVPGEWDGQPAVLVDDLAAILGGQHD